MIDLSPEKQNELAQRIASEPAHAYEKACADKEYAHLHWSIHGLIRTNEILVSLTDGTRTFFAVAPSAVDFPRMIDRRFGIDTADHEVAGGLSSALWEAVGAQLLRPE